MNSGLLEARELASRISQIQRAAGAPSLLEQFATEMHETWERLLEADRVVRALPGADPWVRQNGARILACLPASGEELEPLLQQIGLTAAPSGAAPVSVRLRREAASARSRRSAPDERARRRTLDSSV